MKLNQLLFSACLFFTANAIADPGDTLVVQTYTFEEQNNPNTAYDNPGRRTFEFPSGDTQYQKILMYHTLKCFEDGTAGNLGFPCGEWDYLSYNYLFDHTGLLDSNLLNHPQYLLNNQGFDSEDLISEPQFDFIQYNLAQGMNGGDEILSSIETTSDGAISDQPLEFSEGGMRSQFIYTATELTDLGLMAGEFNRVALYFETVNGDADIMYLRVKQTDSALGSVFDNDDLVEVNAWPIEGAEVGWYEIDLTESVNWDGTSNLLFDLSFISSAPTGDIQVSGTSESEMLVSSEKESFMRFNWYDEVKVPAEAFANVSEQVTIEFWVRGDAETQPQSSTLFEGKSAGNRRELNTHVPWENGRVYWDAGDDGGADRIDQLAGSQDYEGVWNHWAFTKNAATGDMKMFKNGLEWHSGTGKDNLIGDIEEFSIASAVTWTNYYTGDVDEFRVWSSELTQETIQEWMNKVPTADHPNLSDMELRYAFNSNDPIQVMDVSGNGHHGQMHGSPVKLPHSPKEYFFGADLVSFRPNIKIEQVSGEVTITAETVQIPVPAESVILSEWEVNGYDVSMANSENRWLPGFNYIYNEEGELLDSVAISAMANSIENTELSYYGAPFEVIDRYELGRYITPYGINLDLEEGWTWVFDVSDYATLLQGEVELECGNWQELLDLKFLFIEGTPPREVKRVEAFWKGQYEISTWDETIQPQTIAKEEGEEMFRLKTRTSGHWFGQGNNCGEFCNNTHSVSVNGTEQWNWEIMQECADNPLYPQGGTWVYDRAGWCPGAPTTTRDFELTPLVADQDEFVLEYDIDYDPYGNYRFEGQVIAYGPANFQNDVEVNDILAPSTMKVKSRMNPICNKPKVKIRNNGALPLTSCTITYGFNGQMQSIEWTGNLMFLETADVELEYSNPSLWEGEEEQEFTFMITVDLPNGVTDENPSNNTGTSNFVKPPVYTYGEGPDDNNELVIWTRTNEAYWENEVKIEDMNGNLVFLKNDFSEGGVNYRDTIALNAGCYKFHITDSDDDGLDFFANNDGNGYARLKKNGGGSFIIFENDFGKEIEHFFQWKTDLVSVPEIQKEDLNVGLYPNPAENEVFVKVYDFNGIVDVQLFNLNGQMIEQKHKKYLQGDLVRFDVGSLPSGVYAIRVAVNGELVTKRFVVN